MLEPSAQYNQQKYKTIQNSVTKMWNNVYNRTDYVATFSTFILVTDKYTVAYDV